LSFAQRADRSIANSLPSQQPGTSFETWYWADAHEFSGDYDKKDYPWGGFYYDSDYNVKATRKIVADALQ